jgi:hypothetical protein
VTRLAAGVFAVLVLATFGAFFVAQKLKSTDPVVADIGGNTLFSPNGDGRYDRAEINFRVKREDRIDVTMVDEEGDEVRRLAHDRPVRAGRRVRLRWDGRDDDRRAATDGTYYPRIVLRRAGRVVTGQNGLVLDTTPPQPRVVQIGPETGPGPELLPRPDGEPVTIAFNAPGLQPDVDIWRTSPQVRRVTGVGIDGGETDEQGNGTARWSGRRRGRRVAPGTFAVVVSSRDRAGNIGTSVPGLDEGLRPGVEAVGPAGITVRYLAAQPPMVPVRGGSDITVAVDARTEPWRWTLRRVGGSPARRGRRTRGGPFKVRAPDGESGLFLFSANTAARRVTVPVAVDGRRKRSVLVVLPATTWQGRNPVDDDGDGLPNVLDLRVPVRIDRVLAGDGLPEGVAVNEAPLLAALDREGFRYDLTTDVALASGQGPELEGHQGVLLAGDTVWLAQDLRRRLRGFVAAGGTLASFGTGSLRSSVTQEDMTLSEPTRPAADDLFGARIGAVRRERVDLSIFDDDERIALFTGGPGLFPGVEAWEPTLRVSGESRVLSSATTPDGEKVIVAARFGRGLVVRTGVPAFATRLKTDRSSAELVGRIWTLLRSG